MRAAPARVGDPVAAVDTPALVVDLDAFERNLERMAAAARRLGVRLRPHAKTHKSAAVALRQIALGAVGVCVQKTGEAEALAAGGVADIFVSNEVIAPHKLARLAALARGGTRLAVAVDSVLGVERLAEALQAAGGRVEVFVEVEVGQGRCGVPPAEAGALAARVVQAGLAFAGLHAYHGGAQHLRTPAERAAAIGAAVAGARAARSAAEQAGLACPLVTGGGSGSYLLEGASGVYGEIQPGSYVFMDADYARNTPEAGAPRFEHALFVKSQVMSARADQAVIDAGHKAHAVDSGLPTVWGRDELEASGANDEHTLLRLCTRGTLPALGETLWLVPGHIDPTVNLHDRLVAVRGGLEHGVVEALWPVDARGALD